MQFLFRKKIPVFYLILTVGLFFFLFFFLFKEDSLLPEAKAKESTKSQNEKTPLCDYQIMRLDGFKYIRPLMFIDQPCESEKYQPLKSALAEKVHELTQSGQVISASVYFRDLRNSEWISYNDSEKYFPGSLMKVTLMIAYLHAEESKPGILDKKLELIEPIQSEKDPVFLSKTIETGKSYSVKELLRYMISYSDNRAAYLLAQNIDETDFTKTFTDIGLPPPDMNAMNYPISARDYSYFMRTLYNSSYLSFSHSEYAAELLSTSTFDKGFQQGLPEGIKMIHKFGEAGDANVHQLHESGIIYLDNKPYLLTVMTKGSDLEKLPVALSSLSALVYQYMQAN